MVEYRDHPPQDRSFVYRVHPFTSDFRKTQSVIEKLHPEGGGDGPEAVFDGLRAACEGLDWRPHARRLAILVGDAPPHGVDARGDAFPNGCPCGLTLLDTTAIFEEKGVVLYALGLTDYVTSSFKQLAQFTGGDYFNTGQEAAAIEQLKDVLSKEFADLDFDCKVRDCCQADLEWDVDTLCTALQSSRGRVSASLSRLGRRGLIVSRTGQEE